MAATSVGKLQLDPSARKRSPLGPLGGAPIIGGFLLLVILLVLQQCTGDESVESARTTPVLHAPTPATSPPARATDTKLEAVDVPTPPPVVETAPAPDPDAIPGQLIIAFPDDAMRDEFKRFALANGITVLSEIAQLNATLVTGSKLGLVWRWLREHPDASVANNYPVYAPPAPKAQRLAGMAAFGKSGPASIGAEADRRTVGAGVKVAVLDTRVEPHPLLADTVVIRNDQFTLGGGNLSEQAHGTAVAAIIAGRDGIAPGAEILGYNVMSGIGIGDGFSVSRGIIQAVNDGAQIINLSIGGHDYSRIMENAINYALNRGVAVVAATGNDGETAVAYPAQYPGVIAVSGVDANGQVARFSNSGKEVALAAPSVGVLTAGANSQNQYFSGTSAAAPFVSGAIAAVLSENPGMTALQAADLIQTYASDLGAPGLDNDTGAGMIDLERIRQRNDPGFTDLALAGIWLNPEYSRDGTVAVVMTVQNQGNKPLAFTRLEVTLDGYSPRIYQTGSLRPGEVHSETLWLPLNQVQQSTGLRMVAHAFSGQESDSRPGNDSNTIRLQLPRKP